MNAKLILAVVAILVILEGGYITFFPKRTKKIILSFSKNVKSLQRYGAIELIIGIVFLIMVLSL